MNRFNHSITLTLSISIKMGEMGALMLFASQQILLASLSDLIKACIACFRVTGKDFEGVRRI